MKKERLDSAAIIIGYAMSRLDEKYLTSRQLSSWRQAFLEAGDALSKKPASFKNLRDEFDPLHANPRSGWHKRTLRPSRQRVLYELYQLSDAALMTLVEKILCLDEEATSEALDSVKVTTNVVRNVAERLLTGRLAEEYFLQNCQRLIGYDPEDVIDLRQAACGYDFGVRPKSDLAVEVKGLKKNRGDILFTDREWSEAARRRENYWVIVVGNLSHLPAAKLIVDPQETLKATCSYVRSIAVTWRSTVEISVQE